MELSNEPKDSHGAQESGLGGGKDLLYGWLVGRAAADLGLAQALVASEAHRRDQIKRLEDKLLGQIRELEKRQISNLDTEGSAANLAALQAELERFSARQDRLETEQIGFEQIEAVISAKLSEFEHQTRQLSQPNDVSDLNDFKLELKLLADRIARAEFSNQQAQAKSTSETRRLEELVKQLIQVEGEAIRTKMIEVLRQQQPGATVQGGEAEWTKTLDEIRGTLDQALARTELETLRNDLGVLSRRLDYLESIPNATNAGEDQLNLWSKDVNERVNARIDALAHDFDNKIRAIADCSTDRGSSAAETSAMVERIARLERTEASNAAELNTVVNTIKSQLSDPAHDLQATEVVVKMVEETVDRRIAELNDKLVAALGMMDSRDAEIRALNGGLINLTERIKELSSQAEDRTAWEAQQQELKGKFEEQVAERMRSLESCLSEKLDRYEPFDGAQFRDELCHLANRLAQVELDNQHTQSSSDDDKTRSQQAIEALRAELASTRVDLEQTGRDSTQRLIQRLDETFSAKFQQLENAFARERQDDACHETLLNEVRSEMQALAQRLTQSESSAQQTHALMVNEAAQTGQLRADMLSELIALQSKVAERESRDGQLDNLSRELNARLIEIEAQLKEQSGLLSGRDREISQLRLELQRLTQIAPKPPAQSETASRPQVPIGVTVGLGVNAQPQTPQALKPTSAGNESNNLLQSYDAEMIGSNDLKKQLQQRMSADVERVRAELRKRAGVSR